MTSLCGSRIASSRRRIVIGRITDPYSCCWNGPRSWSAIDHTKLLSLLTEYFLGFPAIGR